MDESFKDYWGAEEASEDGSNASLSELSSLPRLTILSLAIKPDQLAENFPPPELVKYYIYVCPYRSYYESSTNAFISISTIDANLMIVFKALYQTLEYLHLERVTVCQDVIPTIDQGGLIKLRSLEIEKCPNLKCVIDMSLEQVPTNAFSSLETIKVCFCDDICNLFSAMLPLRLHKLKQVTISNCDNLQEVFQLEGPFHTGEENLGKLLNLATLKLQDLPELRCIWKGHTQHVSLINLTVVEVTKCHSLEYLFTMSLTQSLVQLESLMIRGCDRLEHLVFMEEGDNNKGEEILLEPLFFSKLESVCIDSCEILEYVFPVSIAGGLVQLEKLTVENAPQLKHVFCSNHGREENIVAGDGKRIVLPNLKRFIFAESANFISFCPENYYSTWPALEEITVKQCSISTTFVETEAVAKVQDVKEKLRVVDIEDCQQLCDEILSQLRYGRLPNLERLAINHCGAKVIFQLEGLVVDGYELTLSLPNLRYLLLTGLEELEDLYKGPARILHLQNLTDLRVSDCQRLKHIFSPTLAQNLLQLKYLEVINCGELEQLIVQDDDEEDQTCHLQHSFFPNLSSIEIQQCHKLKHIFYLDHGRKENVSLKSLRDVEVTKCGSLTYLFTMSLSRNLVQLQSLKIRDCSSLEHLVLIEEGDNNKRKKISSKPLFFSKLKFVLIDGCEILEYIFPISIAGGLVQLEKLTVENAPQLKNAFCLDHGREENIVAGDGKEILLPNLKTFIFTEASNFISFCPQNYHSTWPALEEIKTQKCSNLIISFGQDLKEKLRVVDIQGCHRLCEEILSQLSYGVLPNLEELRIDHCRAKVIFQTEDLVVDGHELTLSLPSLKSLSLTGLEELEDLCKGPARILNLQNLTYLWVSDCRRLKHIFSPTLAQNLLQLRSLNIISCGELGQLIVEDDDEEDQILLKDHLQRSFFPNLSSITIQNCHKLKCLFPVPIARSLQRLEDLIVQENFQLEQVFGQKNETDIIDCKEILMPKLRWLSLKELPSLTNFCHVGYQFIFPYLKFLEVKDCPKRMTRFSFAQNGYVHAQAKAPEMDKEDEGAQFHPKPAVDIICFGNDELPYKLPPYMEN